jgi:ketosteroid isomerase-like protein
VREHNAFEVPRQDPFEALPGRGLVAAGASSFVHSQSGERQVLQDIVIYRLRDGKIAEVREYAIAVPAE